MTHLNAQSSTPSQLGTCEPTPIGSKWAMTEVSPVKPAAPYCGGKRRLAKTIISYIEEIPHKTYAEPFVGMGGVLLRKRFKPTCEIINDLNQEIANLFRVVQRHEEALLSCLDFQMSSRSEFYRQHKVDPSTLTDIERAARFLYTQKTGFGGVVGSRSYAMRPGYASNFNLTKLRPLLRKLHTRLCGVVIECMQYDRFIRTYDQTDTLFYLDPPYYGFERYYGIGNFKSDDYAKLANLLSGLKGNFILSMNDTPEVRALFSQFEMNEVRAHYSAGHESLGRRKELIITNAPKRTSSQ